MTKAIYLSALAGLAMSSAAIAAPFNINNLAVSQVGPGGGTNGALNAQATAVQIREFGLTGSLLGSFVGNDIALGSAAGTTPTSNRLTLSGTATSEGFLTLSNNSSVLAIAGYDWGAGVASPNGTSIGASFNNGTGAPDVQRTVAAISASGGVVYNNMTQAYSNSNFRSAASINGTTFITGGTAGTTNSQGLTGGVRFFDPSLGTTSTQLAAAPTNVRVVNYDLGGQVFFSAQSGAFVGVSVVNGGVATLLPGFSSETGLSTYDFWFRDENTLYVADDGNVTSAKGGLQKWTKDTNTGNWSLAYRMTTGLTAGLRGLAGTVDALGNVILYATTADATNATNGNKLVGIVDAGSTSAFTVLATAPGNTAFRGVDFTPGTAQIPAPAGAALLGLGGLLAARRRR